MAKTLSNKFGIDCDHALDVLWKSFCIPLRAALLAAWTGGYCFPQWFGSSVDWAGCWPYVR
jgi:hypothetical protein